MFSWRSAAIYILFPKLVGLDDAMERFDDATWYWVVIAVGFNVVAFGAYVALFRGVLGGVDSRWSRRRLDWRASYQITMAGLAATRIFSAAGAGGIILTYWALRKAGHATRRAACRMVAFLVSCTRSTPLALIVFGILLRTGVFPGDAPGRRHVVPAGVAAGVMAVFAADRPDPAGRGAPNRDLRGRLPAPALSLCAWHGPAHRRHRRAHRVAFVRHPSAARSRCSARSASGRPTSACSGRASRRSAVEVPFARARPGLLRRHGGQPDPVARGGVGSVDAGHDRGVRPVRRAEGRCSRPCSPTA